MSSAAARRNRAPILSVLREVLPEQGSVLEVASGTGEHISYFATAMPWVLWQPSDISAEHVESIRAWSRASGAQNLLPPLALDVCANSWPATRFDAVLCFNMVHIAPWAACLALLAGSARVLRRGGVLVTYGPYKRDGSHTAPSNAAFDESLRARDPSWGVRDIADMERAAGHRLALEAVRAMPANNFTLIWRRR
jgi:SAM-dependent methyltransferase